MPTRFAAGSSTSATFLKVLVPVTMTSALSDSVKVASAVTVAPAVTATVRRSTLKLRSRKVSSAVPAGTSSNRYAPAPSVVAVSSRAFTIRSIATPGRLAPV